MDKPLHNNDRQEKDPPANPPPDLGQLQHDVTLLSEDARQILRLAGCLAFDLLTPASLTTLLEDDEDRCRRAVHELVRYGLLEHRKQCLHLSHPLIHEYATEHLPLDCTSLKRVAWYYVSLYRPQSVTKAEIPALPDGELAQCLRLVTSCLENGLWPEVQALANVIDLFLEQQDTRTVEKEVWEMRLIAARQLGDRRDEAWCLSSLGYICLRHKGEKQALHWFRQCLPLWRELDVRRDVTGIPRQNRARLPAKQSRKAQAPEKKGASRHDRSEYTKALDHIKGALTNQSGQSPEAKRAKCLWNLGLAYEGLGDRTKAEKYITKAVELGEAIKHPWLEKWREGLERIRTMQRVRRAIRSRQRKETLQSWLRFFRPWRRGDS